MPSLKDLPLLHIETELHSKKSLIQNFRCAVQVVCVWQGYFSKDKYVGRQIFGYTLSVIYKKLPLFPLSTMT